MRSREERQAEFERRETIRKAKYRESMDAIAAKAAGAEAVGEQQAAVQDEADQERLAAPDRYAGKFGLDTGFGAVLDLREKQLDRQAKKRLKKRGLL